MPPLYDVSAESQDDLFVGTSESSRRGVLQTVRIARQPETHPIRIIAVLRGRRNVARILKGRAL